MEALQARIEELESENRTLKEMLKRTSAGHASAYNAIRAMIIEKVQKETDFSSLESWLQKHERQKVERNIMSDLKWSLRVRRIEDFRNEHIEQAKEFLESYEINSKYRKERL